MKIRSLAAFRAAILVPAVAAGCESTDPAGPPAGLVGVGATTFSLAAGTAAADSLRVKVVDEDGRAVSNAQVAWSVEAAASVATVSPATSTTDRAGMAAAALTAGTVAGPAIVRAAVTTGGTALSVSFSVVVNAGAAAQFQAPASSTMGVGVTRPLITALDPYGNPATLAGVTLTSSNTAVAEVSATGVVTSRGLGAATIRAVAGTVSSETRVWVVPPTITACESNTATLCSTWMLADSLYNATWEQGSQAVIRVGHFSADSVRFNRVDPAGTSAGMTAVYRGPVAGRLVQAGTVTWTQPGAVINGRWTGSW